MKTRFLLTTVSFIALKRTALAALTVAALATLMPGEAKADWFSDIGNFVGGVANDVGGALNAAKDAVVNTVVTVEKDVGIIKKDPPPQQTFIPVPVAGPTTPNAPPAVAADQRSAIILTAANSVQNLGITLIKDLDGAKIDALTRIVASGGGNIVASGGGNIVASGGGNIVASGGGNIANSMVIAALGQIGLSDAAKARAIDALTSTAGGGLQARSNAVQSQFISGMDISLTQKAALIAQLPGGSGIVASGGGNLISHDGGSIVASGGGNLISHDGGSIVASGGGNLVAAGGGNLVAAGGGNVIQVGTIKVISNDGGSIVASGGGNLISHDGGSIVASGGGNLVAAGGGNLVAAGGGNAVSHGVSLVFDNGSGLVAAGGGNLVAAGGGNLVAAGGGNLVAAGGGNFSLSDAGKAAIVGDHSAGIVAAGGGNLVAAGGGNLVAAGGGNLVAAGGGNVVAHDDTASRIDSMLKSPAGAGLISTAANLALGRVVMDAGQTKNDVMANAVKSAIAAQAAPPPPSKEIVAVQSASNDLNNLGTKLVNDAQFLAKTLKENGANDPTGTVGQLQAQLKADHAAIDLATGILVSKLALVPDGTDKAAVDAAQKGAKNSIDNSRLSVKAGDGIKDSAVAAANQAVAGPTAQDKAAAAAAAAQGAAAIAAAQDASNNAKIAAKAAGDAYTAITGGTVLKWTDLNHDLSVDAQGETKKIADGAAALKAAQAALTAAKNGDPGGVVAAALGHPPGVPLNPADIRYLGDQVATASKTSFYNQDTAGLAGLIVRGHYADQDLATATSAQDKLTALVGNTKDPTQLAALNTAIATAGVVVSAAKAMSAQLSADMSVLKLQANIRDTGESDAQKALDQAEVTRQKGISATNQAALKAIASSNPQVASAAGIPLNIVGSGGGTVGPSSGSITNAINTLVVPAVKQLSVDASTKVVTANALLQQLSTQPKSTMANGSVIVAASNFDSTKTLTALDSADTALANFNKKHGTGGTPVPVATVVAGTQPGAGVVTGGPATAIAPPGTGTVAAAPAPSTGAGAAPDDLAKSLAGKVSAETLKEYVALTSTGKAMSPAAFTEFQTAKAKLDNDALVQKNAASQSATPVATAGGSVAAPVAVPAAMAAQFLAAAPVALAELQKNYDAIPDKTSAAAKAALTDVNTLKGQIAATKASTVATAPTTAAAPAPAGSTPVAATPAAAGAYSPAQLATFKADLKTVQTLLDANAAKLNDPTLSPQARKDIATAVDGAKTAIAFYNGAIGADAAKGAPAVPLAVTTKITDGNLVRPDTPNGVVAALAPATSTNAGTAPPAGGSAAAASGNSGPAASTDPVRKALAAEPGLYEKVIAMKLSPEVMKQIGTGTFGTGPVAAEISKVLIQARTELAAAKSAPGQPGTPVTPVAVANATTPPANVGAAAPAAPTAGTPTQPAAPVVVATAPVGAPVATTAPVAAAALTPGSKPAPSIGEIDPLKRGGPVMTSGPVQIQPVKEIVRGSVDRGAVIPEQAQFDYVRKLEAEKLAAGNARVGLVPVATPDNPPLAQPINDGSALRTINDKLKGQQGYIIGANRDANGCSTDLQACRITLDPKLVAALKAATLNVPGKQNDEQNGALLVLGTLLDRPRKKDEPLILTGKDAESFLKQTPKFIAMHPKADQALGLTAFVKAATQAPTVAVANPSGTAPPTTTTVASPGGNAPPPTASLQGKAGAKDTALIPPASTTANASPGGKLAPVGGNAAPVHDEKSGAKIEINKEVTNPTDKDKLKLPSTANASQGDHAAPGKDVGEKKPEKTIATGNSVGHATPVEAADKLKVHEAKPANVPEKITPKSATTGAPAVAPKLAGGSAGALGTVKGPPPAAQPVAPVRIVAPAAPIVAAPKPR